MNFLDHFEMKKDYKKIKYIFARKYTNNHIINKNCGLKTCLKDVINILKDINHKTHLKILGTKNFK